MISIYLCTVFDYEKITARQVHFFIEWHFWKIFHNRGIQWELWIQNWKWKLLVVSWRELSSYSSHGNHHDQLPIFSLEFHIMMFFTYHDHHYMLSSMLTVVVVVVDVVVALYDVWNFQSWNRLCTCSLLIWVYYLEGTALTQELLPFP